MADALGRQMKHLPAVNQCAACFNEMEANRTGEVSFLIAFKFFCLFIVCLVVIMRGE
jgi:uncharacterized protein (DUF983 family)